MSDSNKLVEHSKSAFARSLLRSASADRAPDGGQERALVALGIGAAATGVASGAGAAGAAGGAAVGGVSAALKWIAIVVVAASTAGGVWQTTRAPGPVAPAPRVTARTAAAPEIATTKPAQGVAPAAVGSSALVVEAQEPSKEVAMTAPVRKKTAQDPAPVAAIPPPAPVASTLHAETAALDAARVKLTSGHPQESLDALDAFDRAHPDALLAEEAAVLRVEVLIALGQPTAAAALGHAFLSSHPESPYAQRVRSRLDALSQ